MSTASTGPSIKVDAVITYFQAAEMIQGREDILQTAIDVAVVVIDHAEAHGGHLPFVLAVEFRHRNIEFVADLILQAL